MAAVRIASARELGSERSCGFPADSRSDRGWPLGSLHDQQEQRAGKQGAVHIALRFRLRAREAVRIRVSAEQQELKGHEAPCASKPRANLRTTAE